MSGASKNFEVLFQEIKIGNHTAVLSLSSSSNYYLALAESPDDVELNKIRIVALINLGKHSEALQVTPSSSLFDFERAYILYKLSQYQESLEITSKRSEKNFRLLRAQTVRYK
jgi:Putative TPR-like repeat